MFGRVLAVTPIPGADLTALHRSTTMLSPGQQATLPREQLMAMCEELLELRQLLGRLGADLKAVARRAAP